MQQNVIQKSTQSSKCTKFETYAESTHKFLRFLNSAEREKYFKRCVEYELDESRPQQLQIFDMPSSDPAMSTTAGMFSTKTN